LGTIDDWNDLAYFLSNRNDTEIGFNLVWVLQIQMEWDTMTFDNNVHEIQSIVEVQLDNFMIFLLLTWAESDWNFNLFLTWHQNLTWNNWEIKIQFLLKVGFNGDGLIVSVSDCEHLLDWNWLRSDEALAEVEHMLVEFDTWLS
jgi:hypothetical protein